MDFKQELVKVLAKELKWKEEDFTNLILVPPDPKLGDFAFPCFKLGGNPKEAAEKLKAKLKRPKFIEKVEVAGPYLNFFLDKAGWAEETLTKIQKEKKKYGSQDLGRGMVIAMDYSHPNIAKPFGIGHLRSTVIGNSLYQTFKFLGYKPISINHLGDWGTQFGKLIVAYKKWGEEEELNKDAIKHLLHLYVKFHEEAEKDEGYNEQARQEFKKIEDGDKENLALWKKFKELSLKEFDRIYQLLGVSFDSYNGEAFINKLVPTAIKKVEKKVSTEMSEGALVVDLKAYNYPPVLLLKSDGATTYHSRDVAAAFYRLQELKAEKLIYIVGSEQKLYFNQLFNLMELCGYDRDKFVHVDFGLFRFPEGKMSTRKGKVIFLEEVLNKAIEQVAKIIEEKNPTLKNKKKVAEQVGVGAIIFGDLSNDRVRDIDFDWERMLSFDGETGPYLQYTHARACSILRKAGKISAAAKFESLTLEEEFALVRQLYAFPETLVKMLQIYKPHILTNYLITLAQRFNEFYVKCHVIIEDKELMQARLLLVDGVRQVLENGLKLLGIQAPEEM